MGSWSSHRSHVVRRVPENDVASVQSNVKLMIFTGGDSHANAQNGQGGRTENGVTRQSQLVQGA